MWTGDWAIGVDWGQVWTDEGFRSVIDELEYRPMVAQELVFTRS